MKKREITVSIAALLIILVCIKLFTGPKVLGSLNHTFKEPTTSGSDISFEGKEGDKIRFHFKSNVENGDLNIVVTDSDGNEVNHIRDARELEKNYTIEKTDTYTVTATYDKFVGSYSLKITK